MKNIKVVIGANFGDEGKGLMTDYLSEKAENGVVVRFNGGAQAGHTVTLGSGKRHVFGHFGAGTLNGTPTFLSEHFIVNPILFIKELKNSKILPKVWVDRNCIVSTPFDMLINQAIEFARGDSKHGSCGVGINETITRALSDEQYNLTIKDFFIDSDAIEKLYAIKNEYVPKRIKELGLTNKLGHFEELLKEEWVIDRYLEDVNYMLGCINIASPSVLHEFDSIVFEGAQGLLLDENHSWLPHVTRSNTGIKNVIDILEKAGLEDEKVEVVYVTRAYMTRHGAGPFPSEVKEKPYSGILDLTNVPNPFQDTIRYGYLDLDRLNLSIKTDMLLYEWRKNFVPYLAITCLDQMENIDYCFGSFLTRGSKGKFFKDVENFIGLTIKYRSYGPTREDVLGMGYGEI